MLNQIAAALVLAMVAINAPVSADDDSDAAHKAAKECATIQKKSKRLACYDALFREQKGEKTEEDRKENRELDRTPDAVVTKEPQSQEDAFGAPKKQDEEELQSIESAVKAYRTAS